jgi:hypothetical protein
MNQEGKQACSSGRCRYVSGSTGVGFKSLCLLWVFNRAVHTKEAFPTHLHTVGYKYGSPALRSEARMGLSLVGAPLKYNRVVQAGAGYCGSRSDCWVYGIIGSVQAQLK